MNSLKERIATFKSEILLADNSQQNEVIIEGNQVIYSELRAVNDKLYAQFEFIQALNFVNNILDETPDYSLVFSESGVYRNGVSSIVFNQELTVLIDKAIAKFKEFEQAWEKENYIVQQKDSYIHARDVLKELLARIKEANEYCWNEWLTLIDKRVFIEEQVLESQKHNPSQKENYQKFNSDISNLEKLKQTRIVTMDCAVKIQGLRDSLVKLKAQFDVSDFPEDVARFFKALNSRFEPATLDLLTPKVLEWLNANSKLTNFKVERK
ncbi:hypothetical protein [Rheinheimera sp. UJ63]|uniref:hypothetical protein n=1 Tax=Rheinheimera sp. UJ63 TaxID=2910157 RepID=UPI001F2000A6|nr:hypothetical protein [Rheinheimera sp. UJ63]MCF4010633.1 hypothetical protein [Rheinheimera sp. UJ63]